MTESEASRARWFVAQTRPNAENKAALHLRRQGFGVYLPRYLKRRKHARRIDEIAAPLFSRYLFVSIDTSAPRWRAVFSTVGISQLICHGETPVAVDDAIVENLKRSENSGGLIQLIRRPIFKPGDSVQILKGAFSSCIGLFDGMRDEERVTVLLELLGRKVRVSIDEISISAA